MKASTILVLIVLVCCAVAIAGCTSSQTTSSGSPSSSITTSGAASPASTLTTSPTDVMPADIAISVSVGQKTDQGAILVTFNGGPGQNNVNGVTVTVTRADGSTQTKTLGLDQGDQVSMAGTPRTPGTLTGAADRVQVAVSMNNGQTYNVVDELLT
ncbi:MAG: hypothetical protein WAK75_09450 [Methanoregula sp.]|uniref:hypothetical protein n=1 Tax=Methanoregula sp. TaxID=2052170 RepID=UPI003BAED4D3